MTVTRKSAEDLGREYRALIDTNPLDHQPSVARMPPPPARNFKSKEDTSTGTQQSRNPFRVSASGSPRYTPRPDSPATTTSPLMMSRIPRKSPGSAVPVPGHMTFLNESQRYTQPPRPRAKTSTGTGSTLVQISKRSSLATAQKPLPSPPALQFMNPSSPPNAQRTLVDADVVGTPSSEAWPALSPDNVAWEGPGGTQNTNIADATICNHSLAKSVSLHEGHELTADVTDHSIFVSSTTNHECNSQEVTSSSPLEETPHIFYDGGFAPDTTVHALTTPDDEALESTLAHKVVIPPRVSSKRAPLPVRSQSKMVKAAATAAWRQQEAKAGDTKWHVLTTAGHNAGNTTALQAEPIEADRTDGSGGNMSRPVGLPESIDAYHTAAWKRISTESVSVWSQAAGSSICGNEPQTEQPGYRTKRLSDHCSKSERGPMLKIADDADAILLGKDEPPVPDIAVSKPTAASSRNMSMLGQRATFSKPAYSPNQPNASKNERLEMSSKKDSMRSREKKNQIVGEKKVNPKRSIKNILLLRDNKEKAPAVPAVPKRSSLIGSTIRGRFRSPANVADIKQKAIDNTNRPVSSQKYRYPAHSQNDVVQVATPPSYNSNAAGVQHDNIQAVPSPNAISAAPGATRSDAATVINNIITQVSLLPDTSSDRLRGLEIAEVCTTLHHRASMLKELVLTVQTKQALLSSLDACKHAQIAATQARQHGRQAELYAQRSAVELGRLHRLCDRGLDEETVQLIKGLLSNAWDSAFPASSSTTLRDVDPQ
ncbi:hypothetical protein SLS60_000824 [Paraconiothyrium brasiliense]|uniref:Uncharacterized protein n=1 Tax=Paraconiothyrium brasiliense TaxID=300254 RepID=A0ABR3S7C3_9PLEO